MGRSFFIGNEAELSSGSQGFTTLILATPEAYGLTLEQAESYAALNDEWQAAYRVAKGSGTRTMPTVAMKNNAAAAVRAAASALSHIINGTPSVTDAQRLQLGLSVRAKRSPMEPPGMPTSLKVTLGGLGSLMLSWACKNPRGSAGTIYQLQRRIGPLGEFTHLGHSGKRSFHDTSVPAGSALVTYRIQAVRSTKMGPMAEFPVNLGVDEEHAQLLAMTLKPAA